MIDEAPNETEKPLPNATNRLVAVFDDPQAAGKASQALDGVAHVMDVTVVCGVEGAEEFDLYGNNHGMLGRFMRAAHWSTDRAEMEQFDAELRAGHCVVSFRTDRVLRPDVLEEIEPFVRILEANGGRYIHFFGPAVVTRLRD